MTINSPTDRLTKLRDWEKLAEAALAVANRPLEETPTHLMKFIDWAERWPWPQASDTRCRAFQAVLKVVCLTRPGSERAAISPMLSDLAGLVLDSCEAVRTRLPAEDARRAPPQRKDIYG